jgi:hypothetical protein
MEGPEASETEAEGETDQPEELSPFGGIVGSGAPGARFGMEGAGGYPGRGMPGMPAGPGRGMYPGSVPGGAYPGAAMYEEEEMSQPYVGGAMPYGGPRVGRPGSASRVEDVVEYQLFRFFDFNVEQGRRYQYQVRLGLFNPNYQLESRYLKSEDLGKKWWVQTEWSEPSNVVKVPRDSRLLAGTVKPPRRQPGIFTEPNAKVIAVTLRMEDGLEMSEEYTVYRGHLANFEGKIVEEKRPGVYGITGMPEEYEGDMMVEGPMYPGYEGGEGPRRPTRKAAAKEEEEEAETISHATGLVVLDMVGGERLHRTDRSLTEPSSLLLLDPDGNLLVQNELDDVDQFALFHVPEEPKGPRRKKKPGEGMYPGYEGEEMYEEMMEGMYGEGPTPRRGRRRTRRSYEEE